MAFLLLLLTNPSPRLAMSSSTIAWILAVGLLFKPEHAAAVIGINYYGSEGANLQVANFVASLGVSKARIDAANPQMLAYFAGTGVEVMVGVPNDLIPAIAASQEHAVSWVSTAIRPYFPGTLVTDLLVGNEVFTGDDQQLKASLVPAMRNLKASLSQLRMDKVRVSTSNNVVAVLAISSPPSLGAFTHEAAPCVLQLLCFLSETSAPFWINAYPYLAYMDDPTRSVPLEFALGNPNHGGAAVDPYSHLTYTSWLDAQVDAVRFAAARLGYGNVTVDVSETGWPSQGDDGAATRDNACRYYSHLLSRQANGEGTPLMPDACLDVYINALIEDDMKKPTLTTTTMLCNVSLTPLYSPAAAANNHDTKVSGPPHWVVILIAMTALVSALTAGAACKMCNCSCNNNMCCV